MDSNLTAHAISYAEAGWYILPLFPEGKRPITNRGYKEASNDPEQVRQWWTQNPEANIGLVTGKQNGIIVVDIDGECRADFLALLTPTIQVKTGKGHHLYYKYVDGLTIRKQLRSIDLPVDIKSDGGYVLVPPSIHPDGGQYDFITQ